MAEYFSLLNLLSLLDLEVLSSAKMTSRKFISQVTLLPRVAAAKLIIPKGNWLRDYSQVGEIGFRG